MVDPSFCERHRITAKAFSRRRCLGFCLVLIMVLRNSVKSLQNVANEVMTGLGMGPVTASAFSQARYKLKHTAFIELNREVVVPIQYGDRDYQRWWGFRLLAVDGSKLNLPDTPDVRAVFGTIAYSSGQDATPAGERPYALASVLYDVLNRVAVAATLGPAKAYEVDLAVDHLAQTQPGDLLALDRGYASYRMLAELAQCGRDFVVRCPAHSFATVQRLLAGQGPDSQTTTLTPGTHAAAEVRARGLPAAVRVRFLRVRLSTGEWEVLATSLCDEDAYPTADFRELYRWRWEIETFFNVLKTRLELENFTGTGAEAVRQDFHATVYLSGLESILTAPAQAHLDAKPTRHPQVVNRSVSFNALKNAALNLLLSDLEIAPLLAQLTDLFQTSPVSVRPDRKPPRRPPNDKRSLDFQRYRKKHCF